MLLPIWSTLFFGCRFTSVLLFPPILNLASIHHRPDFLHFWPVHKHCEQELQYRHDMRWEFIQYSEYCEQEKWEQLLVDSKLHFTNLCSFEYFHISIFPIPIQENCRWCGWGYRLAFWLLDHTEETTWRYDWERYCGDDWEKEGFFGWRGEYSDWKPTGGKNHIIIRYDVIQQGELKIPEVIQVTNQVRQLRGIPQTITPTSHSAWLPCSGNIFPPIIKVVLYLVAKMRSAVHSHIVFSMLSIGWWDNKEQASKH